LLTSTTPVPIMRVPSGGGVVTHHDIVAGWSSLVARRAHNPKVVGSNPAPATKYF
jgi:lipoate-protein ligase A